MWRTPAEAAEATGAPRRYGSTPTGGARGGVGRATRRRARGVFVGYGRPPVATRFRPGQSGNPRGRHKGAPHVATIIAAALGERITVTENDRPRRVTKFEVAVKQLVNRAARGDIRATQWLIALAQTQRPKPHGATPSSTPKRTSWSSPNCGAAWPIGHDERGPGHIDAENIAPRCAGISIPSRCAASPS